MALPTQPNGSTMIPVAGAPQTTSGTLATLTAQTQTTLVVYHKSGSKNLETVSVIQS